MAELNQIIGALRLMAETIEKNKEHLTELDGAIGDGDHGINMSRGFAFVKETLDKGGFQNAGDLFKKCGMALVAHVGGASGPLYGTAFLRAAMVLKDREDVHAADYVQILKDAAEGIKMRGKSDRGEKTMLDALIPAYEAAADAVQQGKSAQEILNAAKVAAAEGAVGTEKLVAQKGRASYLGERSIGHQDPGAASAALVLAAVADYFAAEK
ncbi:dihydroxyacetone kinase subunit DhaL [Sporolactobacillus spathodeae]|uniref:Dihydroxyacetone kinase-like protein n=1 Tax=Sporolactobacillus spathodeae TaxID=1465502 RepID=A0ABS2QAV0_9BACL|nr:dihydroxyacetone kinase subunit DhaL [Sporolactobacillus spathodeae]MBM7658927.1 dihydroxyacetone kinase-like protein [Sporolactobacillus spathodeae]